MEDGLEFAGKSPFLSPPQCHTLAIKAVLDIRNECRKTSSSTLTQVEDFGRESLGIIDTNHPDFGRESLGFLHNDFGRESLGIINLNSLDIGRESLGITNINTYDFLVSNVNLPLDTSDATDLKNSNSTLNNGFSKLLQDESECSEISNIKISDFKQPNENTPEILLSEANDNSNLVSSILNTAFLRPVISSVSSSISTINPSFNSASLESSGPSRISVSSYNTTTDILNNAFEDTSQFLKEMHLFETSWMLTNSSNKKVEDLNAPHCRTTSLPVALESEVNHLNGLSNVKSDGDIDRNFENVDLTSLDASDGDDEFNDSVFIEGNHFASRVADGSIVGLDDLDNDMLDSIQEPEELAKVIISGDEEPVKCDTETVFKVIDKFLPSHNQIFQKDNNNLLPENLNGSEKSDSSKCTNKSNNSKSKDAMEIITSLSEILNDNPNEKQKCEGHNLLSSLAEILLSSASTKSRSCILDDSGHSSSIESEAAAASEGGECYEVLDLRKKSISESNISQTDSYENCVPLDLSLKSKSNYEKAFVSPKILPPRYSKNLQKPFNENKNLNDVNTKLRPKKTDEKMSNLRKGPMKAVLPVTNMSRTSAGGLRVTPTRQETNCKLKKTSTPINESNLKPMAQSTPDTPRTTCPTSPLARPNASINTNSSSLKQKLNYSGTNLPINKSMESKNKTQSFTRRGSSGDIKRTTKTPFVRSYSVGEKSGLATKINDNRRTSVISVKRNSFTYSKNESNKSILKENVSKCVIRSSVTKKNGKENVH